LPILLAQECAYLSSFLKLGVDSRDAGTFDDASIFTTQTHSFLSGLAKRAFSPIFVVGIVMMAIQKARARAARPLYLRSLIRSDLPHAHLPPPEFRSEDTQCTTNLTWSSSVP